MTKFRGIEFCRTGAGLSEEDLADFETEFGLKIPPDYTQFLLCTNGGSPSPSAFSIRAKLQSNVNQFFSLKAGETGELQELSFKTRALADDLPCGVIPIGRDDYGNHICINARVDDTDYGAVVFEDRELEEFAYLAKTFESFLDSLE